LPEFPGAALPIIAGNVSLYNESKSGAIPASPMISCLGNMPDVSKAIGKNLQKTNSTIVLVGERKDECGGSVYYDLFDTLGANVPQVDLATLGQEIQAVTTAIQKGLVLAAHDISEGGVAVAIAEMSFKNNIGVKITVPGDLDDSKKLFGETGGFVLEIAPDKLEACKKVFAHYQIPVINLGHTQSMPLLEMQDKINVRIADALPIFENSLREKLL
jgi:phosphoribosylformylglycinamidine (FGAM) synthase-like enzyme